MASIRKALDNGTHKSDAEANRAARLSYQLKDELDTATKELEAITKTSNDKAVKVRNGLDGKSTNKQVQEFLDSAPPRSSRKDLLHSLTDVAGHDEDDGSNLKDLFKAIKVTPLEAVKLRDRYKYMYKERMGNRGANMLGKIANQIDDMLENGTDFW